MLARSPSLMRLAVAVSAALVISVLLLMVFNTKSLSETSIDYYTDKAQAYWESVTSSYSPVTDLYNCEDPYRRPGYLHIDPDDYKKTQWIPYTEAFLDAEPPSIAQYPASKDADIFFDMAGVESDVINSASNPRQWMHLAIAEDTRRRNLVKTELKKQNPETFVSIKGGGNLGWLWGRRILILSDSVDRFMVKYFCEEFGRQMYLSEKKTLGWCSIPTLNLTMVYWHYPGSWTTRPSWWWMDDMTEIAFEERWDKLWAPTIDAHLRGPSGRPDLILWQNGLWDQRALWEAGEAHFGKNNTMGQRERQLTWQEIRFVGARLRKLVQRLDDEFGPHAPTMFRAITIHRDSNATDASIYELDRLARAVGERAGHEVFEWGRIITAFSMLYKDMTHTGKGPGSWLWGNMMLEYLARSAGARDEERRPYFDGWDACHRHLTYWGGR